jgi:hypothetical protein
LFLVIDCFGPNLTQLPDLQLQVGHVVARSLLAGHHPLNASGAKMLLVNLGRSLAQVTIQKSPPLGVANFLHTLPACVALLSQKSVGG